MRGAKMAVRGVRGQNKRRSGARCCHHTPGLVFCGTRGMSMAVRVDAVPTKPSSPHGNTALVACQLLRTGRPDRLARFVTGKSVIFFISGRLCHRIVGVAGPSAHRKLFEGAGKG